MGRINSDRKESKSVSQFIIYWMIFSLGSVFISNGFKFAVYDLSGSEKLVSLVGSVSGLAFITLGLISGIIVSVTSNRFFILFYVIVFSIASIFIYIFFKLNWLSVVMLLGFVFLQGMSASLHSAAANRIFYDLCGTEHLSLWLSRRNIAVSFGSVSAFILLSFWAEKSEVLFIIYALILFLSLWVFVSIPYQDTNNREDFLSLKEMVKYVAIEFHCFMIFSWKNKTVKMLFLLSFIKTFFIYWAMSSGVLLKLGIDDPDMRRLYLLTLILMDGVSIIALYFVGKKGSFNNRDFLWGAMVSGAGILFFALFNNLWLAIIFLSLMYIGFAICQMSSGYVLRLALPERFRTQGISFAVIPYYFADIVSGIFFASLLGLLNVWQLLIFSGGGLLCIGFILMPFVAKEVIEDES